MEEVRKWTVTYTKHVKQKRKVYQDGFLHLLSNNKVSLYDECEKLLDSRFLTKEEDVKAGESLAFPSFLVDIGDPESSSASILLRNPKSECGSKTPEKPRLSRGERSSYNAFPNKRTYAGGRKTSANNLSPSQKIIREFKKKEEVKYSTQHSPSSVTPSSSKEWEALYTTQITQKAKKYHDGFLRLIICGSQGRQVALYDSSKTQIDKRFLKKDEVIGSGESLKFDGHLVDIGDALGSNRNDADMKTEASNCNSHQAESGQQWHKLSKENLMYNPQRCKVPARQDHIRAGNSVARGLALNGVGSSKGLESSPGGLGVDRMKQTKTQLSHMPPRDVNHILSILKKPVAQQNIPILEKAAVKQFPSSSEVVHFGVNSKPFEGIAQSNPHQATEVLKKYESHEAAKQGSAQRGCIGNHPQPEITRDNIAMAQAYTAYSSSDIKRSINTQGVAFGSPNKSHPSVGAEPSNKLEPNEDEPVLQQLTHFPGFTRSITSMSPGSQETRSSHQQPCENLPKTDASNAERQSSTSNKPKARRLFTKLAGFKMRNFTSTETSMETLECPSFDLGI